MNVTRSVWTWGRIMACAAVLAVLVWRLGTGPFLAGVRTVDGGALAAAAGVVLVATICSAWRWKVVAAGLGLELSLPAAVAAYYRALFLNVTLPGGVAGDVHRGVSQGRTSGGVGLALRSVAWERFAGQVVQMLVTAIVLLVLPSPVRGFMPLVALAIVVAILGVGLMARARPGGAGSALTRLGRTVAGDIRHGLLARRAWPGIAVASVLILAAHAATFLLAAETAGVSAPPSRMLPIALLVVAAMALPNVAGWGPREGVAAWVFAAAGLGAGRGVAASVIYGVMVLVASLPGAVVLVVAWFRRNHRPASKPASLRERAAHV